MRRTSAEIIAFHCMMDLAEMPEYRYQPTRWANPAIYTLDDQFYYAAPSSNRMPKCYAGLNWVEIGEEYGRKIFRADGNDVQAI